MDAGPPLRKAGSMNPVPRYNFFTAFFRKRTWVEFLYLWSALILAPFGLAYAAVTVVVGSGLAVTVVGLVVGSSLIMAARGWGALPPEHEPGHVGH